MNFETVANIKSIEDIVEMLDKTNDTYEAIALKVRLNGDKISPQTICNWFNRKVKMPQLSKVMAVAHAYKFQVHIVRKANAPRTSQDRR